MKSITGLRVLLVLIAAFHLAAGAGLMCSIRFQQLAVSFYGAQVIWNDTHVYFLRILGSFAFVLGSLAAMASRDPLQHQIVVIAFIEFFVLRNIHRHLYSNELYAGFGLSPLVNELTTAFFGIQAVLLWNANRQPQRTPLS